MNIATAVQTMNEKLGTEVSDAVITYVDEYRDDKLAELRAENRLLIAGLETQIAQNKGEFKAQIAQDKRELEALIAQNKGELEAQIAQTKGDLQAQIARLETRIAENGVNTQKEIRSQTRWIIAALFALAGLVIAALKLL